MGLFGRSKNREDPLGERYGEIPADDREVLLAMTAHGAKLDEPRHVLHYLYVPDQGHAAAAAGELGERGWAAEVREPLEGYSDWLVLCQRDGYVLTPDAVLADRGTFEGAAQRHGGQYDGWEASI